jgi:hypothetical protein
MENNRNIQPIVVINPQNGQHLDITALIMLRNRFNMHTEMTFEEIGDELDDAIKFISVDCTYSELLNTQFKNIIAWLFEIRNAFYQSKELSTVNIK